MPRSSRLETHDHSTCGFMAWCRKSGAQVAGKLENSTAIVAADGEKSAASAEPQRKITISALAFA